MSVSAPGDNTLTLIPKPASSTARVSANPTTPPLAAAYAENPGVPWVPAVEVTLTMRPQPVRFMPGTSSRIVYIAPVRLTARLRFHSSSVSRVIAERVAMPALFTSTSMVPTLSWALAHIAHCIEVGHVGRDADRARHFEGRSGRRLLLATVDDDVCTFGGEQLRGGATDATVDPVTSAT